MMVCFEVAKRCYEFMSACEPQDIYRELKANDLNEWIWNGAGFSSIHSIFIITEKEHPLCSHVAVLPYELYVFVKFFERLGIKKQPDSKQLEHILVKCVKHTQKLIQQSSTTRPMSAEHSASVLENAAKNYPLINWIKTYHGADKKLASIIKDYEESLAAVGLLSSPFVNSSPPNGTSPTTNGVKMNGGITNGMSSSSSGTSSPNDSPTKPPGIGDPSSTTAFDLNSSDAIFLYLPELYKSVEIKDNLISSVATLVKNRPIKILDEEAYLMRKVLFRFFNSLIKLHGNMTNSI